MGTSEATPRIVVVDDDPMVASTLTELLRREGYTVDKFAAAKDALSFLAREHVDAVVSDVSMPGMTGLEMIADLRRTSLDVPVVLVTGVPRLDDTMRAIELGAFRYLTKPLDGAVVRDVVRDAVRWGRLSRAASEAPMHVERAELEAAFTRATDGMKMAYQPIVSATSRRVFGYEALMRSSEPKLPHPPAVLDAAEKLGRLHALGRHLRDLVARDADARPFDHTLFVNLHSADLADPHLYDPASPLTRHAKSVVLEVTERASLEGIGGVEQRLGALRALGFRIAVDDLGAGYAGLSYFARIAPDVVKIDMSLTRNVDDDPVKRHVVGSMCALARDLDMSVVAEGIETERELACVADLGAELVQGYVIARPGPYPPG